jgi:glycosyltransferase involved in cell wall biosynthesis
MLDYGVRNDIIYNMPLPFDAKRFKMYEYKEPMGYFVFFGSAIEVKGIFFLVNFASRYPDIKIKVLPSNKMPPLILPENLEVIYGLNWNNGLEDIIKNSSGALITSLWDSSTEYALIEALGLGVPPIVFNVGVHNEIIDNGVNGFLIEKDDFEGFYSALLMLKDIDRHKMMSCNARKTYDKLTNDVRLVDNFREIYANIIS